MQKVYAVLLIALSLTACRESPERNAAYRNEIQSWQAARTNALLAEDGWLNLVGLFELRAGQNSFGSGEENDLVFVGVDAPARIGYFDVGDDLRVRIEPGVAVMAGSDTVQDQIVLTDADSAATIFSLGSLRWLIIERGEKLYLRLRDLESKVVKQFTGNSYFDIDSKWRVDAKLVPFEQDETVPVPNVLGEIIDWHSPGTLVFEIDGQAHALKALGELTDEELFVIFTDETNGEETYPAGRFMYIPTPGADNKTVIDFNKAYNPPCVYTAYATCPLPPAENRLPLRVEAGEKNYGGENESMNIH